MQFDRCLAGRHPLTQQDASDRCNVAAQIECDFDWVSDQDVEMAVTPLPSRLLYALWLAHVQMAPLSIAALVSQTSARHRL